MQERIEISATDAERYDELFMSFGVDDWDWESRFNDGQEYDEEINWKTEGF